MRPPQKPFSLTPPAGKMRPGADTGIVNSCVLGSYETHIFAAATHLMSEPSDLRRALSACRHSFLSTAFFSLFVNLLMLVPAIYMLAVYDRVLMSGSESTLMMLSLITVFLFLVLGGLEWIRSRILVATSARLDEHLGERVFDDFRIA